MEINECGMVRKHRDEVAAETERDNKREDRENKRDDKRDDKQEHQLDKIGAKTDKIDAQARKAAAVAKKRKWLVFLIGVAIGGAIIVKKYFFGG